MMKKKPKEVTPLEAEEPTDAELREIESEISSPFAGTEQLSKVRAFDEDTPKWKRDALEEARGFD